MLSIFFVVKLGKITHCPNDKFPEVNIDIYRCQYLQKTVLTLQIQNKYEKVIILWGDVMV